MFIQWSLTDRAAGSALLRIQAQRHDAAGNAAELLRAADTDLDDMLLAWAHGLATPGELARHWLARDMARYLFERTACRIAVDDGLAPESLIDRAEELRRFAGASGDWAMAADQLAFLLDLL